MGTRPVPGWLMGVSTDRRSPGRASARLSPCRGACGSTAPAWPSPSRGTLRYRNTEISAYHAYRPPQIDGNLADWAGVPIYSQRRARLSCPVGDPHAARCQRDPSGCLGREPPLLRHPCLRRCGQGRQRRPTLAGRRLEIGLDGRHDHVRNWALDDDRQFTVTALGKIYESGVLLTDVPVAHARPRTATSWSSPSRKPGSASSAWQPARCRPQLDLDRRR